MSIQRLLPGELQYGNSDIRDGRYIEARLGAAYRPVDNERVNALFSYTYLEDLPGQDQVDHRC